MSATAPTPGQIAYAAWHAIVIPAIVPGYEDDWNQISTIEQRAWEAAAQAVLAPLPSLERPRPRCRWCGQMHADLSPLTWREHIMTFLIVVLVFTLALGLVLLGRWLGL